MTDKFAALREAESKRTPGQLVFGPNLILIDEQARFISGVNGYVAACTHPTHGVAAALAEIERLRAIVEHAAGSHHCDRAVDALEGKP